MKPYYADDHVALYLGDCRTVLPALLAEGLVADLIVTDPPYGETSLPWDRWPDGWPAVAATASRSMWCFGSLRMFLDRRDEFAGWRLSQDVVWRKPRGSSRVADRFKRVHEWAALWYQGEWSTVHHETPRVAVATRPGRVVARGADVAEWHGERNASQWIDDGSRLMYSVIDAPNMVKNASHPTEKPIALLDPLIRYGCPPGGLVLDLFAGSASTLDAARHAGRRAVGIEGDEAMCEKAAKRLSQDILDFGEAVS